MGLIVFLITVLLFPGDILAQMGLDGGEEPSLSTIEGKVITGLKITRPLEGVKWSVITNGDRLPNTAATSPSGRFKTNLPQDRIEVGERLIVSFLKPGYEQVVRRLDCQNHDKLECKNLNVKLLTESISSDIGEDERIILDPDEIEVLDSYYNGSGKILYFLPYLISKELRRKFQEKSIFPEMISTFVSEIKTPLRELSEDLLSGLEIQSPSELKNNLLTPEKVQVYGDALNALAMITIFGQAQEDKLGSKEMYLRYQYQMMPYHREFGPIRENTSYRAQNLVGGGLA